MEKKDLKIGGYYISSGHSYYHSYLFKYNDLESSQNPHIDIRNKFYYVSGGSVGLAFASPFTKATQEQIDHLDACIAAGKYVEATEKPKFEVGKWYNNCGTDRDYYAKYDSEYNENRDITFVCSEYIYKGKHVYRNTTIGFNRDTVEVTDLQEIQQYLPDGHPDRTDTIPEYVECIKNRYGINTITIGKVYKTIDKHTTKDCYEFINNQGNKDGYYRESFKPSTKEAYLAQHGKSEELTELPEKWCLKVTSENAGTLNQQSWYDISYAHRIIGRYICGDYFDFRHHSAESYGTEITFEQFKKWVLKEEKSIEPWSVGTYVVLTENYSMVQKGGIYKIDDKAIDKDYISITKSVGGPCLPFKYMCKWFATKEEAEKFAETLRDKPKGIVPQEGKWYEVEDGFGEYYLARYNGGFHCSEIINDGKYETDVDVEDNGEYRIIAEIPSNDPKITGPLLEYAKKRYPIGAKYNSLKGNKNLTVISHDAFVYDENYGRTIEDVKNDSVIYTNSPNVKGEIWAEIISLPEEKMDNGVDISEEDPFDSAIFKENPKSTHKFKVGDSVKIVQSGYGIGTSQVGRIVTITELGEYFNGNGYKISPALGNSKSGYQKGFNGEKSFRLVKEESKLEEANHRFKVGMKIKTPTFKTDVILTEDHFPNEIVNNDVCTKGGGYILYDADLDKWATIIGDEKVEESWVNDIIKESKTTGWMINTIEYEHKPSLNLISFDDEPIIFSKPNKVNSINAELLVIEE